MIRIDALIPVQNRLWNARVQRLLAILGNRLESHVPIDAAYQIAVIFLKPSRATRHLNL